MMVSPDVEAILPAVVYQALATKYPRLYTDRAAPADISGRPVVVIHREGGVSKNRFLDQARVAVDVYAPTEKLANDLALDARGVLEDLRGHEPVIEITATGPAPITGAGKGPQRRFYADALIRKVAVA